MTSLRRLAARAYAVARGMNAQYGPPARRARTARVQFYAGFVSPGDLVFDVGANTGNRTEAFRALGARVVAVEPQAACVDILERRWGDDDDVTIVPEALGAEPGEGKLFEADVSTLSSMSSDWIAAVTESGRFEEYSWSAEPVSVPVTTLDRLIERYGEPVLCKIDVEGYESEVLGGLSRPLALISIEFAAEQLENVERSVARMASLGMDRYAYSIGESMRFTADGWMTGGQLCARLRALPEDSFGDVYASM